MKDNYEIYLDTETLDLPENLDGDILFELAFIVKNLRTNEIKKFQQYYAPENVDNMCIEAMERTSMTPELIKEKVQENTSTVDIKVILTKLVQNPENILFIHNAKFDLEVLKRISIVPKCKVICTLRVANIINDQTHLQYKSTRLSYLHYYYRNDLKIQAGDFHTADYDCLCLMELVNTWKEKVNLDMESAIKVTNNPINYIYCHFGKNRGLKWRDLSEGQLRYFYELNDPDICYTIDNL